MVERALHLACSLRAGGDSIAMDMIAFVRGLQPAEMKVLRQAGFRLIEVSEAYLSSVAMVPLFQAPPNIVNPNKYYAQRTCGGCARTGCPRVVKDRDNSMEAEDIYSKSRVMPNSASYRRWPKRDFPGCVQTRNDHGCTSLKFLAWNMTEYDVLLHTDVDTFFLEDPWPWVQAHADHYFIATHEIASRGFEGLNTHMMLLQPSNVVFRMLADASRTGGFTPYTNSDQDVIEQLFSAHLDYPELPTHLHGKGSHGRFCKNSQAVQPEVKQCVRKLCTHSSVSR